MTTIKTMIFASAAVLAMQAAPALAQSSADMQVFTRADLQAALDANGATYKDNSDNRTIDVAFSNGLNANAAVMACDDDDNEINCYGTSILATFGPPDGASDAAIAQAISEYNYRQNFGRAYVDPNGRISVRLYIISDGGIQRENYRRQIELWSVSLEDFTDYLYGTGS